MRFSALIALASVLWVGGSAAEPRDYDAHDYYAVHLDRSIDPKIAASHLGAELEGPLGHLEDYYLFRHLKHENDVIGDAVRMHKKRKRRRDLGYQNEILDGMLFTQKQKLRAPWPKRIPPPSLQPREPSRLDHSTRQFGSEAEAQQKSLAAELDINDPEFGGQWHLFNTVQLGHDLNISGVWREGITGKDVKVCIVDDGLDMESEDLRDNYYAEGSYDFNDNVPEPKPRLSDDRHGTRCAGEVAAVKNDICGIGVAYDSKIAGVRILSAPISDADEAAAMTYGFNATEVYSCSWGPVDNGQEMGAPGILIKRAMLTAIQKGRGGKGTIYVFAAGNGARDDDNCNFDGYTNSIYSITVGAIDREGNHPYYSEKCSAQLVVTYSSGDTDAIHTTDVGPANCYDRHGGTSAAGPLAVGVYALVLQVRPDLTWRDMQSLQIQSAVRLNNTSDWQLTANGKEYSHQYGYGKIDAGATIEMAKNLRRLKRQAWLFSPWQHIRHDIPEGNYGLHSTFTVTSEMMQEANLEKLEHVTVTMNVNHTRRGDLSVDLISPFGVTSHLSTARRLDEVEAGYEDWTFMSVAHWGEDGIGEWTIIVRDTVENEHHGTFVDWKLNLFGESIFAEEQTLLPLPNEDDDDEHDREGGNVSTASVTPSSTAPLDGPNPTDHPHRPINQKPSTTESSPETTSSSSSSMFSSSSSESTSQTGSMLSPTFEPPPPSDGDTTDTTEADDSYLPSSFPTFGVSKRTQLWIYIAFAIIILFCLSLLTYWALQRRKRRSAVLRDSYEFEMLEDDDDDDEDDDDDFAADPNAPPRSEKKRRSFLNGKMKRENKKRAGELYDAFAGESDEELFSDDERYQDHYDEEDKDERGISHSHTSSSSASGGREGR